MSDERARILAIIDFHGVKAAASEYDRGVCVTAVSRAREQIVSIPEDLPEERFVLEARRRIGALVENYHDSDGEFTSGRSAPVPILDDFYAEGA